MKILVFLAIAVAVLLVVAAFVNRRNNATSSKTKELPKAKPPLTDRELSMFFRLSEAFPQPAFVVLSQVSFSALLTAKSRASRNSFDRKTADFVVCNNRFAVMAAIELDDASHTGKATADGARDQLLTNAGYKVLRYKQIPDTATLKSDMTRT